MKSTDLHEQIRRNGWKFVRASGSHYFYEKDGKKSPPVPYHGAKEMGKGLVRSLIKAMELQ